MSGRDPDGMAEEMHRLMADLYPLCRSITGDGLRDTLRGVGRILPLTLREVPSGTRVFDWTVPPEWNIRDAWVTSSRGARVIDFRRSNLHVVGYSVPVRARLSLAELKPHLTRCPTTRLDSLYLTSYQEGWICLPPQPSRCRRTSTRSASTAARAGSPDLANACCPERRPKRKDSCTEPVACNDNLSGAVAVLGQTLAARPPIHVPFPSSPERSDHHWLRTTRRAGTHPARPRPPASATSDDRRTRKLAGDAEMTAPRHVLGAEGEHAIVDFTPWDTTSGVPRRLTCPWAAPVRRRDLPGVPHVGGRPRLVSLAALPTRLALQRMSASSRRIARTELGSQVRVNWAGAAIRHARRNRRATWSRCLAPCPTGGTTCLPSRALA
jgi:hypothetical protein